ncbi:MAG: hypothetical protein AAFX05_08420 [Planctomycetota bacterium]
MTTRFHTSLAAALLVGVGSIAHAQVNTTRAADIDRLVAELDADDFEQRERASMALRTMPGLRQQDLIRMMRAPGTSPEQRLRLLDAAKVRFYEAPRPGIGIAFGSARARGDNSIIITTVQDDMPAGKAKLLVVNDIFRAFDGVDLATFENGQEAERFIRASILSYAPGGRIPAIVDRGGVRVHVDIPLGGWEDLQNPNRPPLTLLHDAWQIHIEREKLALPAMRRLNCAPETPSRPIPNRRLGGLIAAPLQVAADAQTSRRLFANQQGVQRVVVNNQRADVRLNLAQQQARIQRLRQANGNINNFALNNSAEQRREIKRRKANNESLLANRLAERLDRIGAEMARARVSLTSASTPAERQLAESRLRDLGDEFDSINAELSAILGVEEPIAEASVEDDVEPMRR